MKMYIDLFNVSEVINFSPAPSWRLLTVYGGFMTIQEFRDSFTNYVYVDKGQIVRNMRPVGHKFEEHMII